ncbi:hypothetical protein [Nannocystis pusilla]|uniref:hypothetical protein n=1 Tax=Nannocystis pusilla TaxID=889268 RepID=UPI003B7B3D1E
MVLACGTSLIHWDLARGEPTRSVTLPDLPEHVMVDEAGRAVVVGSEWIVHADFAGGTAMQWYHAGSHSRAALSRRGNLLAVADRAALELWDVGLRVRTARIPLPAPALAVAVDDAEARIAVAGQGWHRVYDRGGALLRHQGTAVRAVVEWTKGPAA